MRCPRPTAVDLLAHEKELFAGISVNPGHPRHLKRLQAAYASAKPLAKSLLERDAIPLIRLEYFTNPDYNVGSNQSRREVFESNGTRGEAILAHGHFLPYLKYFVEGPSLDPDIIDGFCQLLDRDEDLPTLKAFARTQVRQKKLDGSIKSEEFYKLALECELTEGEARAIRDAVRPIRP